MNYDKGIRLFYWISIAIYLAFPTAAYLDQISTALSYLSNLALAARSHLSPPVLAALIGSISSAACIFIIHTLLVKGKEKRELYIRRRRIVSALRLELQTLYSRFNDMHAESIRRFREANHLAFFSVGLADTAHNYFVIFDGNAGELGILDESLAANFVSTYIHAKAIFDSLVEITRMNVAISKIVKNSETLTNSEKKWLDTEIRILNNYIKRIFIPLYDDLTQKYTKTIEAAEAFLKENPAT